MPQQSTDPKILASPRTQRRQTLQVMRLGRARVERLLSAGRSGKIDMQGLFRAQRGDALIGAGWGQVMPGRAGYCWPACLVAGEPETSAKLLQDAVDRYLDAAGTVLTQAILPHQDVVHALRLSKAEYHHVADLEYYFSSLESIPVERPPSDLEFVSAAQVDQQRIRKLIDRTYEKTLDCTSLHGVRSTDDVLTSYRHTGEFRAEWWIIARHDGQDVGCVLLAGHSEYQQCELMYLGIVPEVRGRNWGYQITQHALWVARRASMRRMVLAVDDTNWPARDLYDRMGFEIWDRRTVYVRTAPGR